MDLPSSTSSRNISAASETDPNAIFLSAEFPRKILHSLLGAALSLGTWTETSRAADLPAAVQPPTTLPNVVAQPGLALKDAITIVTDGRHLGVDVSDKFTAAWSERVNLATEWGDCQMWLEFDPGQLAPRAVVVARKPGTNSTLLINYTPTTGAFCLVLNELSADERLSLLVRLTQDDLRRENAKIRLEVCETVLERGQWVDQRFQNNMNADSFSELVEEHPLEFEAYVRPLLKTIGQEHLLDVPDSQVASLFISKLAPSLDQRAAFAKELVRLNAEEWRTREEAEASIFNMGYGGMVCVLQADRTNLSPEQTQRLDSLLIHFGYLAPEESAKFAKNKYFLLRALETEDEPLRNQVQRTFETLTSVGLDAERLRGANRSVYIDSLIKKLTGEEVEQRYKEQKRNEAEEDRLIKERKAREAQENSAMPPSADENFPDLHDPG